MLAFFLGLRITRFHEGIKQDQQLYIEKILEKFGMAEWKPVDTPAVPNVVLSKNGYPYTGEFPYRSLVGNLLYLAK